MLLNPAQVPTKSDSELQKMRDSGKLLNEVFEHVGELVRPGATTAQIDDAVRTMIERAGGRPSFLNYMGFPKSICASVNEELVHGIPSPRRVLQEGDIISIDIGLIRRGWHADRAETFGVGMIDAASQRLIDVTALSFWAGAARLRPGAKLGECQHATQTVIEDAGMSVIKRYVGHGIGRRLHEPPQIPNYGSPNDGFRLRPGMVFAIEPMVALGGEETVELDDKWTVIMADGARCAHYEHTVAVTPEGPEILTWTPEKARAALEMGAAYPAESR